MKKLLGFLIIAIIITGSSCSHKKADNQEKAANQKKIANFVFVKGGSFKNTKSKYYRKRVTIANFYIGKYEVTQKEWFEVMKSNPSGFKDKNLQLEMASNLSEFKGKRLPVETVSWYDCVEYCNKRSLKEGLKAYYNIDENNKDPNNKNDNDNIKWTVTINKGANGYRLPTEMEWEYASGGGNMSKSYTYSGSNDVNQVAWDWINSGDKKLTGFWSWNAVKNNHNKTKSIGSKKPNELGLYDMSGNVREWCWDFYGNSNSKNKYERVWRGGCWLGDVYCCESSFRGSWSANLSGNDTGLRVCRSK